MTEQKKELTSAAKSTETAKKVRPLVKTMYARAHEAKEQGRLVAYCMLACQYDEILRAMDITPIWTENYGGLCGTKRDAERFLMKAEFDGYSNVLCSYATTGIGFDAMRRELGEIPPDAPDGGMAEPDMLLGCSAACDPRYKWYQALGHYKDTPIYNIDVVYPPIDADVDLVRDYYLKYQVEELKGLVDFLEKQTGRKMDWELLDRTIDLAEETSALWREVHELRKNIPCPMPAGDHFRTFVPGRFWMGTQEALEFYRELRDECKQRVDNGIGVIPNEKYRLLWGGGLPPWHTMSIFNYFEDHGAVFVRETSYSPYEPVEIPPNIHPLERLAWRVFGNWTFRNKKAQKGCGDPAVQRLLDWIDEYNAVGMVMHQTLTCRATTIGQIHYKRMVQEHFELPIMLLESDIVDVRAYSETQTKERVDAFIELIDSYKKSRAQ
jgi:benzoyl-CoA reductase/2-hydroxyglutaryl-CoA dehydratase subunit BcrC/BadD/HgdB